MEYKFFEDGGEIKRCDSCHSPTPLSDFNTSGRPRYLCHFCAATMAGRHTESPIAWDNMFARLRAEVWKAAACSHNLAKYGDGEKELQLGEVEQFPQDR